MTNTVVIDKDKTITVKEQTVNTVVIRDESIRTIVTGIMGPPGKTTVSGLEDVDVTTLNPGSVLVYNTQTQKWISTTLLNQQIVDSGQY